MKGGKMNSKTMLIIAVLVISAISIAVCSDSEESYAPGTGTVASIDGTEYTTLEQAINEVGTGQTIVMTDDYTMQNKVTISVDKNFTLNLGNHTIYASSTHLNSMFINNGTVTVTAGDQGGIDCATYPTQTAYPFSNHGSLTIIGGTYSGDTAVQSDSGSVTIESGTFTGDDPDIDLIYITGGTCTVTGGTFTSERCVFNNQHATMSLSNITATSSYCVINTLGGKLTIDNCDITSNGNGRACLENNSNGTIITNTEFTANNGAGCVITGPEYTGTSAEINGCTMNLTGTTTASDVNEHYGTCISVGNGGIVDVIDTDFNTTNYGFYIWSSGGTINVKSGTFTSSSTDKPLVKADYNSGTASSSGTKSSDVNILGGSFTGNLPSSLSQNCFLLISGGTFSDKTNAEKYLAEGKDIDENGEVLTLISVSITVDGTKKSYEIATGEALPSEGIPNNIPGYTYLWDDIDMTTLSTMTFDMSTDIEITKTLNDPSVEIEGDREIPYDGGTLTLEAVVSHDLTQGINYGYTWFKDDTEITGETDKSIKISAPGDYSVKVIASDGTLSSSAESEEFTISIGATPEHTVTLKADGKIVDTLTVRDGGSISESDLPGIPQIENMFGIGWSLNGEILTFPLEDISSDLELVAVYIPWIEAKMTLSGELYEGECVTATIEFDYDTTGHRVLYLFGPVTDEPEESETATFVVTQQSDYVGAAFVFDQDGMLVAIAYTEIVSISCTDRPYTPPISGDDDDYIPLPPSHAEQSDSGDDDSTAIVACAAAAVVAALMATFLIIEYRRR